MSTVSPSATRTASRGEFSVAVLTIDPERVSTQIAEHISTQVRNTLRRGGVVIALSGGIDSSVCAALSVKALGADRVFGLLMPERDSSDDARRLAMMLARSLGITTLVEDITQVLTAAGCYARQDEAIRVTFPDHGDRWQFKIALPSILGGARLNVSLLTVRSPSGDERTSRMSPSAYRQLVAATNFKQRTRAMLAYYHADRLNYAVVGTPNRLEYDQGFFVKGGDGAADLKPIAHLYKTQVYALAEHLGVPEEIRQRTPTTDTYSMPQTQEEFFFALPYDRMDLCLYGYDHHVPVNEVGAATGLTATQVELVYKDIEAKRRAARYLHLAPLLMSNDDEI
jgi:NAD+ synthase